VDQPGNSAANVGDDLRRIAARQTEIREHRVGRRGKVGRGVEQRAVQVAEDGADTAGAHPADASAARIAAIVAL
jgi:hypothetical protein